MALPKDNQAGWNYAWSGICEDSRGNRYSWHDEYTQYDGTSPVARGRCYCERCDEKRPERAEAKGK